MFENYKESLFDDKIILRSQQRFRSDHHRVYTEEVNKIALSSNDDKRIQTYDKITTYPYGTNVFKVCEGEMLLIKIITKNLGFKMEDLQSNNKLQEIMSKLAILKSDTQKVISEQELSINKPNIDDKDNKLNIDDNDTKINIDKDNDNKPNIDKDTKTNIDKDTKTNTDDSVKTPFETKDKINNKLNLINEINTRLAKAKTEITNNIKVVYKAMSKLKDDSWLRLVKLNKMNAVLDDAINVVQYEIYGKKRQSPKMINIDKNKDIDVYVDKLTDIINK